jgi:hypothetical protein
MISKSNTCAKLQGTKQRETLLHSLARLQVVEFKGNVMKKPMKKEMPGKKPGDKKRKGC